MQKELFRKEAIQHAGQKFEGEVILYRPVSFLWLTLAIMGFVGVLIAFLTWADYTRKETAGGQLATNKGVARVFSPLVGEVVERRIADGAEVNEDDVLFVVSVERDSPLGGDVLAQTALEAERRIASLNEERQKQNQLAKLTDDALANRERLLESELAQLKREIGTQQERLAKADRELARFRELAEKNFVSAAQLSEREELKLDQVSRTQALERSALELSREIATVREERPSQRLRAQAQQSTFDRQISVIEQERANIAGQRGVAIRAPMKGVITTVVADVGQQVGTGAAMATILPADAELEAHLLVTSRAVGFLQTGQEVRLRYSAFPYQRFGHQAGTVKSISKTTVNPQDLASLGASNATAASAEPYYRVIVTLDKQHVNAYGKQQPLIAGMQLEADIRIETRKLYQLVLDPLYSLAGRL